MARFQYVGVVMDTNGNCMSGIPVTVAIHGGGAASIYAGEVGGSPLASLSSDITGTFTFWADNTASYDITPTGFPTRVVPGSIPGVGGPPSGAAGGDVGGTYPTSLTIVKDAVAATASMRTLGTGTQQAMAGNDPRIISLDEYFIAGDADDAASINRAQAALPAAGGKIRLRNRAYICASVPFSFDSTSGVTLEGVGGGTGGGGLGGTPGGGSEIIYTGSAARFISARNSQAFTIRDIAIYYTNASFTGSLVDFSSSSGTPATNMALEHVSLESGGASPHTATLLNLDNAINGTFTKVQFMQGNIAVQGKSVNTNFSICHTFKGCLFQGQATVHVKNVGEVWEFDGGCDMEALSNGKAGAFSHDAGVLGKGLTYRGWMGDATVSGGAQITWSGAGLNLIGARIGIESTGTVGIKVDENGCSGIAVIGSTFVCAPAASATAFAWGSTTGHSGVVRLGNTYESGVTKDTGTLPGGMIDQLGAGLNAQVAGDGTITISSNATNSPVLSVALTNTSTTPRADLQVSDGVNFRTMRLNPSGGSVSIGAGGGNGVGLNGNAPVVKAAAVATPNTQTAAYVQADVASIKTAVDAIRVALTNIGITA